MAHPEAGYRLLEKVVRDLEAVGQVEIPARMEGRSMTLLMVPRASLSAKAPEKKPAAGVAAAKPASAGTPSAAPKPATAGPKPATAAQKPPRPRFDPLPPGRSGRSEAKAVDPDHARRSFGCQDEDDRAAAKRFKRTASESSSAGGLFAPPPAAQDAKQKRRLHSWRSPRRPRSASSKIAPYGA